jgi:3-hydroxyisobutyrate dehydrogenase-like beta-hydroxyacid dehydrogenase
MAKTSLPQLGLIGAGSMGGAIALRLLGARYPLAVYDTNPRHLDPLAAAKAVVCDSPSALAATVDVVLTSLPSSEVFVQVVEGQLLPGLASGKTVIDLGMTELSQTRRLAEWLETRGVHFLDAPVSGSPRRAKEGRLSLFVGGRKETFKRWLPVLKVLGGLGSVTHCGPAGSGQIVKGAEQLALGLAAAAVLEAVAYGESFGVSRAALWESLEKSQLTHASFHAVAQKMLAEGGESVSVCYGELPYVLEAAAHNNQRLPLAQAVVEFLRNAPPSVIERGHHVPSFWQALKRQSSS